MLRNRSQQNNGCDRRTAGHDENGIMWPVAVAPYHVIITVVKAKDAEQMALAEKSRRN